MDQTSAAAFAENLGQSHWGADRKRIPVAQDTSKSVHDFLWLYECYRESCYLNGGFLTWIELAKQPTRDDKPPVARQAMWSAIDAAHPEWVPADTKIQSTFVRPPELYRFPDGDSDDDIKRFVAFYHGDRGLFLSSKRRFFTMITEAGNDACRMIGEMFPSHARLKTWGASPLPKVVREPVEPVAMVAPRPQRVVVREEPRTAIRQLSASPGLIPSEPLSFVLTAQVQVAFHTQITPVAIRGKIATFLGDWLRTKAIHVPDDVASRASWESSLEGSSRQCWLESDSARLAMRLDEPCHQVLGRIWRTEVVLIDDQHKCSFAVRVSIMTQPGGALTLPSTVPAWVAELGSQITFVIDGLHQTTEPHRAVTRREIELLERLIRDHKRRLPVLVVAADPANAYAIAGAARAARELVGVAHVFAIGQQGMTHLQNMLGEAGYVPDEGVRLYGRTFETAAAAQRCPTLLPPFWPSEDGFAILKQACAAATSTHRDAHVDMASYAQVRQVILRDRHAHGKTAEPSAKGSDHKAILAERDELRTELNASLELVDELNTRCGRLQEDLNNKDALLWIRDEQIQKLRERLKLLEAQSAAPTLPTTWDELTDWAQAHHGSRVVITDGAQRAARESPFEDIPQLAKVIGMLGDHYWTVVSTGDADARQKLTHALKTLNVTISGVGMAVNHHRFVDKYRTTWRGRSYLLDQHVCGSSSRDRRHCLRVYFTWDKEHQVVIVGSYPEHKENTLT